MEKQLFIGAVLLFFGTIATVGVVVWRSVQRDKKLDAEAIGEWSDTSRPLSFEEAWDAADDAFMRKWAHVTSRDYQREDKDAAQQLIVGRKSYRRKLEALADAGWDRVARKARLSHNMPFCKDFIDLQADLSLVHGENGYHGSMADTMWTEEDSRKLNKLLIDGARHYRKYKRKVYVG